MTCCLQGSTLAKAREVGERVIMLQARDLQLNSSTPAAAGAAAAAGAGSLGRQRLQSVLLNTDAKADDHSSPGKWSGSGGERSVAARTPKQQQQQGEQPGTDQLAGLSLQPSLDDELQYSPSVQQHQQQQPVSKHQRLRPINLRQQEQQQQQYSHNMQHWAGSSSSHLNSSSPAQAPTADFVALQQQMAMLQHTLASQQQQQQQQHVQYASAPLAYAGSSPPPAAVAVYGPASPGQRYPYVHPAYGSLSPSPTAMQPSLAAGLGIAPTGAWGLSSSPVTGVDQHTVYAYPPSPPPAAAAASSPGGGGDPALAAAVAAHMRDMTLLRMDVERTRGTAELQQARAELAALQHSQTAGVCL